MDILITFTNKGTTGPTSPIVDGNNQTVDQIHVTGPITPAANWASAGCNVWGAAWNSGPYTAKNVGNYECVVTVLVQDASGNQKLFSVDPEVDVMAE